MVKKCIFSGGPHYKQRAKSPYPEASWQDKFRKTLQNAPTSQAIDVVLGSFWSEWPQDGSPTRVEAWLPKYQGTFLRSFFIQPTSKSGKYRLENSVQLGTQPLGHGLTGQTVAGLIPMTFPGFFFEAVQKYLVLGGVLLEVRR